MVEQERALKGHRFKLTLLKIKDTQFHMSAHFFLKRIVLGTLVLLEKDRRLYVWEIGGRGRSTRGRRRGGAVAAARAQGRARARLLAPRGSRKQLGMFLLNSQNSLTRYL